MGLFSFLFGGKKKAKAEAPAKPVVAQKPATTPTAIVSSAPAVSPGVMQARLRLRMAASLRTGAHAAAYEAAKGLADIQTKAGRRTAARVWSDQAEKIRASLGA